MSLFRVSGRSGEPITLRQCVDSSPPLPTARPAPDSCSCGWPPALRSSFQGSRRCLPGRRLGPALFQAFSIGLGTLLLAGLWTPIAGALVTVDALWEVFSSGHPSRWIMLAALAAALVLIGPGAWSVDARLFGWRRLDIRDRKHQDPPP